MLHFTIDSTDSSLNLGRLGMPTLPLLYCMRCELAHFDFAYRFTSPDSIEILKAFEGDILDSWAAAIGMDFIPKQSVKLIQIPEDVEALFDRLNNNEKLSKSEEATICRFTGNYAKQEVGSYPVVDVINQISGRSFLCQRLDDPECVLCGHPTTFLASITNDEKEGFIFTFPSIQIVFFICLPCKMIHVQHST